MSRYRLEERDGLGGLMNLITLGSTPTEFTVIDDETDEVIGTVTAHDEVEAGEKIENGEVETESE